jgi:hypothetical protein
MAQSVFVRAAQIVLIPVISPFDVYADGDAFGAAIDVTSQLPKGPTTSLNPAGVAVTAKMAKTFLEVTTIYAVDHDYQKPEFDLYFRGEDFANDIADNDPWSLVGSDQDDTHGPIKVYSSNWVGMPVGAETFGRNASQPLVRVPLDGSKLLVKFVIRTASTFTSANPIKLVLVGHQN